MSRHNRRRTRGGHKPFNPPHTFELTSLLPTSSSSPSAKLLAPSFLTHGTGTRRGDLTAKHWQNRYIAWQAKDKKQVEERAKLAVEKKRMFGGESDEGDEEGLCSRMLEYFGGLDFIE